MQQTDEVPADVHRRGLEALNEELGPVEMINFLHYYNSGSGDYTRDRHKWLGEITIDEIISKTQAKAS